MIIFDYRDTPQIFSGLRDSWVESAPEGNHVLRYVGEKTAIAMRSDRVYALDPERNQFLENCGLHTGGYTVNVDCE